MKWGIATVQGELNKVSALDIVKFHLHFIFNYIFFWNFLILIFVILKTVHDF